MSVAVIVGLLALVCVFAIMIVVADEYTRNNRQKVLWLFCFVAYLFIAPRILSTYC